jgi:hypothetical protein
MDVTSPTGDLLAAEVTLGNSSLESLSGKSVEVLEVKTDMGTMSFSPDIFGSLLDDFLGTTPTATADLKIELSVEKVGAEALAALSPAQKAAYTPGAPVFDLSLVMTKKVAGDEVTQKLASTDLFDSNMTIEFPYTPAPGEDPNNITMFYLASDGTLKNIGGVYDPIAKVYRAEINHFSLYMLSKSILKFLDTASFSWAIGSINALSSKGIIVGKGENMFQPSGNVTRAEFARMITLARKLQKSGTTVKFTDVKASDWFFNDVVASFDNGVIAGYPDKTFKPGNSIKREDIAVMLVNSMGTKAPNVAIMAFTDAAKISEYAKTAVAKATEAGILMGDNSKRFNPQSYATRAEAAVMMDRYLKFILK